MADESIQEEGGLIDRIKESPRTVSAVIIILIVAAAIYAFSGDEVNAPAELAEGGQTTEEGAIDNNGEAENGMEVAGTSDNGTAEEFVLPEPQKTSEGFMEVAQPGEGLTHLARRATTKWLLENQTDFDVTDEHRIYMEDYIQKKLGSQPLELGQTETVTTDLITEALAAASELNETQLQNLSQYTYVLQ